MSLHISRLLASISVLMVTVSNAASAQSDSTKQAALVDPAVLDEPVRILSAPAPHYPPELRNECGWAQFSFIVGPTGRVEPESIQLLLATQPAFGVAAAKTIEETRFSIPRLKGVPVRIRAQQRIAFTNATNCRDQQATQHTLDSQRLSDRAALQEGKQFPGVSRDSAQWPFFATRTGKYYFHNTPTCRGHLGSDLVYFASRGAAEGVGFSVGAC